MKKVVTVTEVAGEGLMALIGKKVILLCQNYFYTGTLVGVNKEDVLLENPSIVYETGQWSAKSWTDAQALPTNLYVRTQAIEAYMEALK